MTLRTIVPSLAILAVAPFAQGLEIEDGDVKMKIGVRIQSRIEIAQAKDASDNDYDIWERESYSGSNDDPQQLNFLFRRVRLKTKGSYAGFVKWWLDLDFDKVGKDDNTDGPDADLNGVGIKFEFGGDDMEHAVSFMWDSPAMIMGVDDSSSKLLMPTGRTTGEVQTWSEDFILLRYEMATPVVGLTIDLGNADVGDDGEGNYQNNNYVLGARVSTPISEDMALGKGRRESFVGAVEGFGHELGVALGFESWDGDGEGAGSGPAGDSNNAIVFGIDYLAHLDQLTFQFDFAYRSEADGGSSEPGEDDRNSIFLNIQGAYAIPLENDLVVEPALRLGLIDLDAEFDDEQGVYQDEGGASGTYFDLGLNVYTHGHNSKFQFNLAFFSPEEGDGDATIFRAQHALDF